MEGCTGMRFVAPSGPVVSLASSCEGLLCATPSPMGLPPGWEPSLDAIDIKGI